jgi:hypothetical protein
MKTVEEYFSTFKKEGNTWPKGLLVRLRDGSFEKVFAVIPSESYDEPYFEGQNNWFHRCVIGKTYSAICPWTWGINGTYCNGSVEDDDDRKFFYKKDIVEIYSGELIAKTEDKDEQATD